MKNLFLALLLAGSVLVWLAGSVMAEPPLKRVYSETDKGYIEKAEIVKSEEAWKSQLTTEQYSITRKKITEPAYSGAFCNHHGSGIYQCACCGNDLFSSTAKFDSGTGWPCFWQPIAAENIMTRTGQSTGVLRTEVLCALCHAHLGYVYQDGPKPTGARYCINSGALKFMPK